MTTKHQKDAAIIPSQHHSVMRWWQTSISSHQRPVSHQSDAAIISLITAHNDKDAISTSYLDDTYEDDNGDDWWGWPDESIIPLIFWGACVSKWWWPMMTILNTSVMLLSISWTPHFDSMLNAGGLDWMNSWSDKNYILWPAGLLHLVN